MKAGLAPGKPDRYLPAMSSLRALPILAVLLAACSPSPEVSAADAERARAALLPLKQGLMAELSGAMADGGPERAIKVCRERAPAIAAEAAEPGIRLGRTSHRLRNPDNAPPAWVEPLLADYVARPAQDGGRAVRRPDGGIGYVEPIHLKPLCLACHGTELDASVQASLRDAYPDDVAVGFAEGDFRGLFWAELPAGS